MEITNLIASILLEDYSQIQTKKTNRGARIAVTHIEGAYGENISHFCATMTYTPG